jgi:hypothetical protein
VDYVDGGETHHPNNPETSREFGQYSPLCQVPVSPQGRGGREFGSNSVEKQEDSDER